MVSIIRPKLLLSLSFLLTVWSGSVWYGSRSLILHFDEEPDPALQYLCELATNGLHTLYRPSTAPFFVSVHGPPWLHFDADPDLDPVSDFDMMWIDFWLAFHSGAGPVSKMMRIRIRNTDLIHLNKLFGSAALLCFFFLPCLHLSRLYLTQVGGTLHCVPLHN